MQLNWFDIQICIDEEKIGITYESTGSLISPRGVLIGIDTRFYSNGVA